VSVGPLSGAERVIVEGSLVYEKKPENELGLKLEKLIG